MSTRTPSAELEPVAREQAQVLRNLFELYAHDFSEFVPLDLTPSGRFGIQLSDVWWTSEDRFPYFIRANGHLAGFALVARGSRRTGARDVLDVAEFFVVRGARGRGVGTRAAHALFKTFPGKWEIRVRQANSPAMTFWIRVVETWIGHPVTSTPFSAEGATWDLFCLDSAL